MKGAGFRGWRTLTAALTWIAMACTEDRTFRPLAVGDLAPRLKLRALESDSIEVGGGDSIQLVNIWATWCIPCRAEFPDLQALHEAYAGRGVRVLAVSIDQGRDGPVREFAAKMRATFTIGRDPDGNIEARYQTVGVPETFLIDRKGRVAWRKIGALQPGAADARTSIEQLLDSSPEPR